MGRNEAMAVIGIGGLVGWYVIARIIHDVLSGTAGWGTLLLGVISTAIAVAIWIKFVETPRWTSEDNSRKLETPKPEKTFQTSTLVRRRAWQKKKWSPADLVREIEKYGKSDEELYEDAKGLVIEARGASASFLQRRLRISYDRARQIVDELEKNGVVGPASGVTPREILIDSD